MNILGIETSCDETACAIIKNGDTILGNVIASSLEMHSKTGGIIPEKAAREQIKSIIPVIDEAIRNSKLSIKDIDALAVTVGPGLIGSLLVGVEVAKTLSLLWQKPIVPVNHLVAHIYANFLETKPTFPALVLIVSGGHTDLVLLNKHNQISWLGGTRDDAAGEAFDKCARLLGLPYPGGPSISEAALKYDNTKTDFQIRFPRPLIGEDNLDLSFSGLKTAVYNQIEILKKKNKTIDKYIPTLAFEIQEAICDVLVNKTLKAVKKLNPKSLLLGGGVSANNRLKEMFKSEIEKQNIRIDFYCPSPKLSTDNAAAIASAAYFNYSPKPYGEIKANPELTITDVA